jgi:hypothetical protein
MTTFSEELYGPLLEGLRAGLRMAYEENPSLPTSVKQLGSLAGIFEKALTSPTRDNRLLVASFILEKPVTTFYDLSQGEIRYFLDTIKMIDEWEVDPFWRDFLNRCEEDSWLVSV